jgi:O-antigen/teichoic acid export membrane protein
MRWYLLLCPITAVMVLCLESLRALGDFRTWNAYTFVRGMFWFLALAIGVLGTPSLARIVAIHLVLSAGLALWLLLMVARRTARARHQPVVDASEHIRYGVMSAASTIPRTSNAKLDQVVMSFRSTRDDLGLYSAAVGWSAITMPVMRGFTGVATPHISEAEAASAPTRVRNIVTMSLATAGALVLGGVLVTIVLWHLRFDSDFNRAFPAALILIPAGVLLELNAILGNVLRSLNRPGIVAVLEVAVMVVSTVVLLIILGFDAVTGPALVSLGTYLAASLLYLWLIARYLGVPVGSLVDPGIIRRMIAEVSARVGRKRRSGRAAP